MIESIIRWMMRWQMLFAAVSFMLSASVFGMLASALSICGRVFGDTGISSRPEQRRIDWSIGLLVGTAVIAVSPLILPGLSWAGRMQSGRYDRFLIPSILLAFVMSLLLWLASATMAVLGRGAQRKALLVAHGLILATALGFFVYTTQSASKPTPGFSM